MRETGRFRTIDSAIEMGLINPATAALVKNFDRFIEGTLRLYNQKGIYFNPQTRLALADVTVMLSIP